MRQVLLAFLMFIPLICHATVYQWTDTDGNQHFSDQRQHGAQKFDVQEPQSYQPPADEVNSRTSKTPYSHIQSHELSIEVIQPMQDETIRNANGLVAVSLDMKPSLPAGHRIQVILDDEKYEQPRASTNFTLQNVDRGTHTLSFQVVDNNGSVVQESEPVTIYLHRNTPIAPKVITPPLPPQAPQPPQAPKAPKPLPPRVSMMLINPQMAGLTPAMQEFTN